MAYSLFDSVKILHDKLQAENLDIHQTHQELDRMVIAGRESTKLKIITQFIVILEVLARNYEYDDAETIAQVKGIVKHSLKLIIEMVNGEVANTEGIYKIQRLIQDSKVLLIQKFENEALILDEKLLIQLAYEIKNDVEAIKKLLNTPILADKSKQYYETIQYYFQKLSENFSFVGIKKLEELMSALSSFINTEYKNNHFIELGSHADFLLALEYLEKFAQFIKEKHLTPDLIGKYFVENPCKKLIGRLLNTPFKSIQKESSFNHGVILTEEEISALLDDDYSFEVISFDETTEEPEELEELKKIEKLSFSKTVDETHSFKISNEEYQNLVKKSLKTETLEKSEAVTINSFPQEDTLIKYIGKLFQKQEQICSKLTEEKMIEMADELTEMKNLTKNIKQLLFDYYYISAEKLFGKDIREYIHTEVKKLGKKIRLGIRGEKSEILTRESEFVKHIVFTLVKNSLHFSLEPIYRRRAIDKSEAGWLLIEFEDVGGNFDIHIRDDGRGLVPDQMNITELQDQVINKGGMIEIDSVENEYLKIHIQLPMKKILVDCLVVQLGQVSVLIPNRCISRIIDPKDSIIVQRDEHCLGQINLATMLGFDHIPINMMIICEFGSHKVVFGVEKILYNMEAVIENVDMPLIPCADAVSIIKDGSLGFILNEKSLYQKAQNTFVKRDKIKEQI